MVFIMKMEMMENCCINILARFWLIIQYHLATFQLYYREKSQGADWIHNYSLIKRDASLRLRSEVFFSMGNIGQTMRYSHSLEFGGKEGLPTWNSTWNLAFSHLSVFGTPIYSDYQYGFVRPLIRLTLASGNSKICSANSDHWGSILMCSWGKMFSADIHIHIYIKIKNVINEGILLLHLNQIFFQGLEQLYFLFNLKGMGCPNH